MRTVNGCLLLSSTHCLMRSNLFKFEFKSDSHFIFLFLFLEGWRCFSAFSATFFRQMWISFFFSVLCKTLHTSYNLCCVEMWPDLQRAALKWKQKLVDRVCVRVCGSGRNVWSRDWTVNPAHIGRVAIRATCNYSSDSFDSDGVFAFIWVWTGTVPIHFARPCDCEAVVRPSTPNQTCSFFRSGLRKREK